MVLIGTSIIHLWAVNYVAYSNLVLIAYRILAAPLSSPSSQHSFSVLREISSDRQYPLKHYYVESCMSCVQFTNKIIWISLSWYTRKKSRRSLSLHFILFRATKPRKSDIDMTYSMLFPFSWNFLKHILFCTWCAVFKLISYFVILIV